MNQSLRNFWVTVTLVWLISVSNVFSQTNAGKDLILATTNNGQSFTANNLNPNASAAWNALDENIAKGRQSAFESEIGKVLFKAEAKARQTTVEKLLESEFKRSVTVPKETEIQQVYNANLDQIGNRTLEEVRPQIVAFLQRQQEEKLKIELAKKLQTKYKPVIITDINSAKLKPTDVIFSLGLKKMTAAEFDEKVKPAIYELRFQVYDLMKNALEQAVYSNLVLAEAQKQKIEPEVFIRREISDKVTDYSPEEQARWQMALQDKLFRQYGVKFNLPEPEPPVLKISVGTSPARGRIDAPVTVVMFSDFQCSHCAATHPILQEVLAGYGDKVRFVVRDFPLVEIHKDAFLAAQAAAAANAQGKFFEYLELLYKNQDALDNASLKKYAAQIGLDVKKFALDLDSGKFAKDVEKDMRDGEDYGVAATPTVFINGIKVRDFSAEGFRKLIDKSLAQKTK